MHNLYRVSNLAVWLQQINKLYLRYLLTSTTFTQCAPEAIEFGEKTQNKGHYAVQGHSRSPSLVPIECSYATSC